MKTKSKNWLAVVGKDKWVTKSYVQERHCLFSSTSLSPNSVSDSESVSSQASCSFASCDCCENVFNFFLPMYQCSFGSFRPTFQFRLGCIADWIVSCFWWLTIWREKWREYLLFAFFVGFSFLFGARGVYSSGWEPNFNAHFCMKANQLEQVMPLLSMTVRSSAVKH